MRPTSRSGGFTLIELMIVVAVLAVLALIVLPKMAQTIRKGNEAGSKGHLGAVRSALRIYYLDNEEKYPSTIDVILAPGNRYYNGTAPQLFTAQHGRRTAVTEFPLQDPLADTGEWGYVNGAGPDRGVFWIQCTHADLSGKIWSQY